MQKTAKMHTDALKAQLGNIVETLATALTAVAQSIHAVAPKEELQPIFDRAQLAPDSEQTVITSAALATELRLPVTTVERAIERLSVRFAVQARRLGITSGPRRVKSRARSSKRAIAVPTPE